MPPLQRRKQIDRSTQTRQQLVAAAIVILCREGFGHATTATIAARAGVTTGALHHHFPSKDDLLFGVLDHLAERIVLQFGSFGMADRGKEIELHRLIQQLWAVYGDEQYWAIWEIIIATRADARLHERMVQHRERTMEAFHQAWLSMHPKLLRVDRRTADAFELLLVSIRGLCLERFLKSDDAFFQRQLSLLAKTIAPLLTTG